MTINITMKTFKQFMENKFFIYKENNEYDEYILSKEKYEKEMEKYKKELDEYKNQSRSIKKEFAQKLMDAANKNWDEGKNVIFNTMTKTSVVTPKNRSAIRINGSELEIASGKKWTSLYGQSMLTMAYNLNIQPPTLPDKPDKPDEPDEPLAHKLTPDQYVNIKGGDEFWRNVHKQAIAYELESNLVEPNDYQKIFDLYQDLKK
jgi:hypothetical protein